MKGKCIRFFFIFIIIGNSCSLKKEGSENMNDKFSFLMDKLKLSTLFLINALFWLQGRMAPSSTSALRP